MNFRSSNFKLNQGQAYLGLNLMDKLA